MLSVIEAEGLLWGEHSSELGVFALVELSGAEELEFVLENRYLLAVGKSFMRVLASLGCMWVV